MAGAWRKQNSKWWRNEEARKAVEGIHAGAGPGRFSGGGVQLCRHSERSGKRLAQQHPCEMGGAVVGHPDVALVLLFLMGDMATVALPASVAF